jgi:hypothetical protein
VERDLSNGEQGMGDGKAITITGTKFNKGLGAHANSSVQFDLTRACTTFSASIGIDDEVGGAGSTVFAVFGDGAQLYTSGNVYGGVAARAVTVPVSNVATLELRLTDAGDGNGKDHGDWANAQVICTSDTTRPTVTATSPAANANNVSVSAVTATFSEAMRSSSITGSSMTLMVRGTTTAIAATVTYDVQTRVATLKPASALRAGTSYTATVVGGAAGVKDLAGNPLNSNLSWNFNTK